MCVVQKNMIRWRKLEQIKTREKTKAKTVRYLNYVFQFKGVTVSNYSQGQHTLFVESPGPLQPL